MKVRAIYRSLFAANAHEEVLHWAVVVSAQSGNEFVSLHPPLLPSGPMPFAQQIVNLIINSWNFHISLLIVPNVQIGTQLWTKH